ncbi:alpha/beta fold hydrolase [Curtobacterium caseinilyticum]|uniref:Alpha/beta hydrolase n=1 Tax=Curtobacterium caseinilyticum TaxID=3055137 RepID=A0ABT7TL77_9MICO|nr:hypothetical protein [Curtobacterium caseinilyticum]MDM7890119.1 hypothetical protein [Curtobacterium caseinilyticum]
MAGTTASTLRTRDGVTLAYTEPAVVPSTVVLCDDSAAVLPDPVADRLAATGWTVQRLPGVHHDMQLEDPERVSRVVDDALTRA